MNRIRSVPAIHLDDNIITYHCPKCRMSAKEAKVKTNGHYMTTEESRLNFELRHVGHELLTCPCGNPYSWFEARRDNGIPE